MVRGRKTHFNTTYIIQIERNQTMRSLAVLFIVSVSLISGMTGCDSVHKIKLSQVSAPARSTIEKLTAGGEIKMIDKETSNGKIIYDVEAVVNGKDMEYDISEDGKVLSTEEAIPYNALPEPVKQASEKYFGSAKGLGASKEIEGNLTNYEVEGKKSGKEISIILDQTGNILEEEK